jgi:hypothetical protein
VRLLLQASSCNDKSTRPNRQPGLDGRAGGFRRKKVAGSVTDIGSGVEVRAATDTGLPSHGPKRALAIDSAIGSTQNDITRGGHS